MVGKKMAHAWWSFYSLYMGEREKNTKINVTFSLSGWAMPFLQRRPGLWQMLRLSPRTESPRSVCLRRGRRKENIPGIPAAAPISRPGLGPAAPCHPASKRHGPGDAEPTPSPAGPAAGWKPAPGPRSPRRTHGVASQPSERSASCNVFS